jgi:hypothetical protein
MAAEIIAALKLFDFKLDLIRFVEPQPADGDFFAGGQAE